MTESVPTLHSVLSLGKYGFGRFADYYTLANQLHGGLAGGGECGAALLPLLGGFMLIGGLLLVRHVQEASG